ncbi:MAG: hypothetical protein IT371_05375 [Deltaproteobacteria bacterium]|nr:hypothetical protein [Deltaproteobacteria bacterium]
MSELLPQSESETGHQPSDGDIAALIREAEGHPLGIDYLLHGALNSVAATFGAHAFVVLDARRRVLRDRSEQS